MSNAGFKMVALALWLLFQAGCGGAPIDQALENDLREDFPNLINVRGVPSEPQDRSVFCFADQGAWHGFSLPDLDRKDVWGGFPGPYLIQQRIWLGPAIAVLHLSEAGGGDEVDLGVCRDPRFDYHPGLLRQELRAGGFDILMELIYTSSRSAFLRAEIWNRSKGNKSIRISWTGEMFPGSGRFELDGRNVTAVLHGGVGYSGVVTPSAQPARAEISENGERYRLEYEKAVDLASGESVELHIGLPFCFGRDRLIKETVEYEKAFADPNQACRENRRRWNSYLKSVLDLGGERAEREIYWEIAVKCAQTLMTNWRSPAGDLLHDGLFPSYRGFTGIWAWDSWKHAVALTKFFPWLAKQQIRAMFDYQDDHGMVADVIYYDKTGNNWRDTKPPLSGWAVWSVYEETGDREFLEEMFPKLLVYHKWWYEHRDHDGNGLCEYGSTDGTRVAAAWESGMDNAVRFDDAQMVQNSESGWSLNQESVDLNSYLYAEKEYLASMASTLGLEEEAGEFRQNAEGLKELIRRRMFDDERGFYYDLRMGSGEPIKIEGPEGWIPLWTGVATEQQAIRIRETLIDPDKFATYIPFPTLAADHPELAPDRGYWRGPVWLDQAYFAIEGLRRYGYGADADMFAAQIFDRLEGLKDDQPIHENYNPLNGKALNAPHFSWSAAHLLLLYGQYRER